MNAFLRTRFPYSRPLYSIHSLQDLKKAIYKDKSRGTVFSGAQARIVRLTKRNPSHAAVYDWLAERVYEYLNNGSIETQASFDEWHQEICRGFCSRCAAAGIAAQYGMAQKFLNVAMKYAYCFGDSNTVDATKFRFCHFILDGITYYSAGKKYWASKSYSGYRIDTPFFQRMIGLPPSASGFTPWSKLSEKEYKSIQTSIRGYFLSHPLTYGHVIHLDPTGLCRQRPSYQLSPFESEFFVW